ncbi:cadherin-like protein 26 [Pseudorasbora parva]|uniref:cadherin-like protein 26 n=1 Tax=Pseudorasbora parva TaxID=51549 RepID=UPI00351F62AA
MTKGAFFLFLLALVEVTASNKNDAGVHEKQDTVLIRSKRRWVLSTIDLEENSPGPYPLVVTQMFNDKKGGNTEKFRIKGDGVTKEPLNLFSIDENDGTVYVHRPIDREMNPIFHVDFDVLDRVTGEAVDKTLSFNVEIKDLNDNRPVFNPEVIHAPFAENIAEGTPLTTLQAHDNDQMDTPNSQFTMRVVSQEPASPKMSLRDMTGTTKIKQLIFTGCFDYDKAKLYKVLVEAKDKGSPAMSSTATVLLNITDSNTHLPEFTSAKYNIEVMEMESNKEILRIGVKDKDTPNTPASRAVFTILKGNEDDNYKIETDPKTNEGVLSVIKGKNFEKTEITELEIAVANEEKLFQCVDGKVQTGSTPKLNTVKVAVKVIDVNDPPVFKKTFEMIYRNENGNPGDELFVPEVKDEDSDVNNIRYELVQDPAKWVSVDPKTGKITTVQTMDRESSFVKNGTYTVVVQAIDDGKPPATGSCTVVVYLGDVNDNAPYLTSKNMVMCVNKVDRVTVVPADIDGPPYSGPFTFSLGGDNELKKFWKLEPTTGANTSLISLTSLPYGNYSVPIKMQDQQALPSEEVLEVVVCECTGRNVCRGHLPFSSRLGPAAIGLLFAGLLLLALLLLFCFFCDCKSKNFQHIPLNLQDEGNQTLVKYNEEGGGSIFKPESMFSSKSVMTDGIKIASAPPGSMLTDVYRNGTLRSLAGYQHSSATLKEASNGRGVMGMPYHSWSTVRRDRGSFKASFSNGGSQMSRTFSLARSERNLGEQIERKISGFSDGLNDYPDYSPYHYNYEGQGSACQSLDQLTVSNLGENLDFLQNLGPKFNTLGGICQHHIVNAPH